MPSNPPAAAILERLAPERWPLSLDLLPSEAVLVGGAVRDALLDRLKPQPCSRPDALPGQSAGGQLRGARPGAGHGPSGAAGLDRGHRPTGRFKPRGGPATPGLPPQRHRPAAAWACAAD